MNSEVLKIVETEKTKLLSLVGNLSDGIEFSNFNIPVFCSCETFIKLKLFREWKQLKNVILGLDIICHGILNLSPYSFDIYSLRYIKSNYYYTSFYEAIIKEREGKNMLNLNKDSCEKLINEDITWLIKNTKNCLEQKHIIQILKNLIGEHYVTK